METETGSKKVGHGHGGDQESESNSSNAAIDQLPPEMLQSIYKFLPYQDLLACREVNKQWKTVATDAVRKRCAPFDFSRRDIPKSQRGRAVQSFCQLIRAANEQGDIEEFPVTEFRLDLNSESEYYWIEMGGSTLISQFLEAVSPFVKHIVLNFRGKHLQVPNNCLAALQDLTFRNLTKITLSLMVCEEEITDSAFSFIRTIMECPNIKEIDLTVPYLRCESRRWIVETGIEQNASLVTAFSMSTCDESDFQYLNELGFKLKYFSLVLWWEHNGNTEIFKAFFESQSHTLTTFDLSFGNGNSYQYFKELPCLPHLKNLKILHWFDYEKMQLPTLFYKEQLPALETINVSSAYFATDYLLASHMAPSESLRELILPFNGIEGAVVRQVARLFPNLKKLQVFHDSAPHYMSNIYEELPGIEELRISTVGVRHVSVDEIITGLPKTLLRKTKYAIPPADHLSKALSMLERKTTKTLACLENLKILQICSNRGVNEGSSENIRGTDFKELSGVVLKQMKSLQCIDFGIRKYGPNLSVALKEDLEAHGIKLFIQRPPFIRSRTDFFVSLTEPSNPGTAPDGLDSSSDSIPDGLDSSSDSAPDGLDSSSDSD